MMEKCEISLQIHDECLEFIKFHAERHVSTSHGPRGEPDATACRAVRLADCTSGLMQPLTRELIFHRGYVCRVSLSPFLRLSFSLRTAASPRFIFHRLHLPPRPPPSPPLFVLVRVIYLPSASLTVNPSHAIYHPSWKVSLFTAHSRNAGDCLRSLFRNVPAIDQRFRFLRLLSRSDLNAP